MRPRATRTIAGAVQRRLISARLVTARSAVVKLARLRRVSDAEIARTAPPELPDIPDDFWREARVVTPVKQAISIRLDADVIEWFRATGPRYQTRMNAVLRSYVEQVGAPASARPAGKRRAS